MIEPSNVLPVGTLVYRTVNKHAIGRIKLSKGDPLIGGRPEGSYVIEFLKCYIGSHYHDCSGLTEAGKGLYMTYVKDPSTEGSQYIFDPLCDRCEQRNCNDCSKLNT